MEYVAGGIVLLLAIFAIFSTRGRTNAIDRLVAQHGLSRMMLDQLSSTEIAKLKASIQSLESSKDGKALKILLEKYKLN